MRLRLSVLMAAAWAACASAQGIDTGARLPSCSGAADCPLIDFTRNALGPGLDGVDLTPAGAPGLLLARTGDRALPAFRLIWLDQEPALAPERAESEFRRGLARPGRLCSSRPITSPPMAAGLAAFDVRCAGGSSQEVQIWLLAAQGASRTRVVVLLSPLEHGPALLARGARILGRLAAAAPGPGGAGAGAGPSPQPRATAAPPRSYEQLRLDCADDSHVQRQIEGCNAVLANPAETGNYAIALNNRGHAQERGGNAAAALQDYDRALQRDPNYVVAYINRARILAGMGRQDEALAALAQSIAIEDSAWARLDRARLFAQRGDQGRAFADLDHVLQRHPDFAEGLVERGGLYAGRGDHQAALRDFEAALAAEPNNAQARDGRDRARLALAGGAAPAGPQAPPTAGTRVETVRGLTRDRPFSLTYPSELEQGSAPDTEVMLSHPTSILQVSLKIADASPGANAQTAARAPASGLAASDRRTFPDFAIEHRSLVNLPAGPAHLFVASMTSQMADRARLRLIVAEMFSEGRRYELAFVVAEDGVDAARDLIGFVLANFSPASAPRPCCAEAVALPW